MGSGLLTPLGHKLSHTGFNLLSEDNLSSGGFITQQYGKKDRAGPQRESLWIHELNCLYIFEPWDQTLNPVTSPVLVRSHRCTKISQTR